LVVKRYHVGVRDFRDDVGVGKEVVGEREWVYR